MHKRHHWIRDTALTLVILSLCFGVSLLMQDVFQIPEQVTTARTCANALTLAGSHMPDLIILDLGLPDADGITLLKAVRQHDLTPIIVLSARTDESDKVEAFDLGANDYVTKPFSAAEFLARVRSTLRFSRHSADEGRLSGATLGGNCTPIGASANITGIGILRKEGCEVKNADFFKIGIPFTLAAIIPAYIYLWLFYGV